MRFLLAIQGLCSALAYTIYSHDNITDLLDYTPSLNLLNIEDGSLLAPLLVPRVSGTQGATDVFNWMHDYLSKNLSGWVIEEDRFTDRTPLGDIEFVNLIATMDPPKTDPATVGRLVLAAHYDSLRLPAGFIGASDSSVPCAILLYIAQVLSERLPFYFEDLYWDVAEDEIDPPEPRGIQLIFFDGEEAVVEWTDTDSIYGARHLAQIWEEEKFQPSATASRRDKVDSIDLMVLLDLLGNEGTTVPSSFSTTHWAYERLAQLETTLSELGKLDAHAGPATFDAQRQEFQYAGHIGDDHIPFMQRNTQILHAIAMPFPEVWHTMDDDAAHLHQGSINNLARIFTLFTAEWIGLPATTGLESSHAKRDELEI